MDIIIFNPQSVGMQACCQSIVHYGKDVSYDFISHPKNKSAIFIRNLINSLILGINPIISNIAYSGQLHYCAISIK